VKYFKWKDVFFLSGKDAKKLQEIKPNFRFCIFYLYYVSCMRLAGCCFNNFWRYKQCLWSALQELTKLKRLQERWFEFWMFKITVRCCP